MDWVLGKPNAISCTYVYAENTYFPIFSYIYIRCRQFITMLWTTDSGLGWLGMLHSPPSRSWSLVDWMDSKTNHDYPWQTVTRGCRTNPVHPVWKHIGTHIRWMLYVDLVPLSSIPFETMGRRGSCSNSQLELESSTTQPCKWMHAKSPKQCTCVHPS